MSDFFFFLKNICGQGDDNGKFHEKLSCVGGIFSFIFKVYYDPFVLLRLSHQMFFYGHIMPKKTTGEPEIYIVSVWEEIPHSVATACVKLQVWWGWHKPLFIETAAYKLCRQARWRISWCVFFDDHVARRTQDIVIIVIHKNSVHYLPLIRNSSTYSLRGKMA